MRVMEGVPSHMRYTPANDFCFPRFDVLFVPPANGSAQHGAMAQTVKSSSQTLNSWKEIAQYLDRGVRTIQRWEHGLGLPVHRIGKGKRSPVFATASELNFWLSTVVGRPSKPPQLEVTWSSRVGNPHIESLRRSCLAMRNLSHAMAEKCAQQRRQVELAREQMVKLRLRLNRADRNLPPDAPCRADRPIAPSNSLRFQQSWRSIA